MLRVHCVQLFYNLSDPGMEDLLYEVESVRRFVGLRLTEALPDETTILNFRHLLEKHGLGEGLFEEINAHLASRGHRLRRGRSLTRASRRERAKNRRRHGTLTQGKQWRDRTSGWTPSSGAQPRTAVSTQGVEQAERCSLRSTVGRRKTVEGHRGRAACGDEAGARRLLGEGVAEEAAEKRRRCGRRLSSCT